MVLAEKDWLLLALLASALGLFAFSLWRKLIVSKKAPMPPTYSNPASRVFLVGNTPLALVKREPGKSPVEVYTSTCDVEIKNYFAAVLEFGLPADVYWVDAAGKFPNAEPDYDDDSREETPEEVAYSKWDDAYYPPHLGAV